jgi:hypothetical protein
MPRDAVDVVAMLDISTNMQGEKLECVKEAMLIMIDKLGPHDRLSIVLLQNHNHRRLMDLSYMSDDDGHGGDAARFKVAQLKASSGRYMGHVASAALQEGAQVQMYIQMIHRKHYRRKHLLCCCSNMLISCLDSAGSWSGGEQLSPRLLDIVVRWQLPRDLRDEDQP